MAELIAHGDAHWKSAHGSIAANTQRQRTACLEPGLECPRRPLQGNRHVARANPTARTVAVHAGSVAGIGVRRLHRPGCEAGQNEPDHPRSANGVDPNPCSGHRGRAHYAQAATGVCAGHGRPQSGRAFSSLRASANAANARGAAGAEALETGHTDLGIKGLELLGTSAKGGQGDQIIEKVMLTRGDNLAVEAAKLLVARTARRPWRFALWKPPMTIGQTGGAVARRRLREGHEGASGTAQGEYRFPLSALAPSGRPGVGRQKRPRSLSGPGKFSEQGAGSRQSDAHHQGPGDAGQCTSHAGRFYRPPGKRSRRHRPGR